MQLGAHCVVGAGCAHRRRQPAASARDRRRGLQRSASAASFQTGAVIGADGFGFAPTQGRWVKIEQLGGVRIGDDVDIGANTCIDRGALDDTVIEDGVKLDNLIQIGHNVPHRRAHGDGRLRRHRRQRDDRRALHDRRRPRMIRATSTIADGVTVVGVDAW